MAELFLDFETRSRADLKKAGAHRYAEDPSTEALCASWALDDEPLQLWNGGWTDTRWPNRRSRQSGGGVPWLNAARDPRGPRIVAHNAEFERLILKHVFHLDLPASRFRCTAAQSARAGLPRKLELAGIALGLKHQKDAASGKRLINQLSKPDKKTDEFRERDDFEDEFEQLEAYNAGDVETMRDLRRALPPLSDTEQALWELTVRMNDRGFAVDLDAARRMEQLAEVETARLTERWFQLTGVKPNSPKARAILGMKSLNKVAVRHALRRPDLPPNVREALLLRQRLARASVKKLAAFFARTSLDGRLRGSFTYAGAERTARWSAGGVQPQNFMRGLGKGTDLAFELLGADALDLAYDDILRTLAEMLKGLFVGSPGYLIGDFGQIEARALAVLAGQDDLVYAFEHGVDVYCQMASSIYGTKVGNFEKTNDPADYDAVLHLAKRQLGKVAVLGCGYGLGPLKFVEQMDANFDVQLDEQTGWRVVDAYRAKYPRIVEFWQRLENFFRQAVRQRATRLGTPGWPFYAGVRQFAGRDFAFIELPSGRPMYYYQPEADHVFVRKGYDGEPYEQRAAAYYGRNIYKGGKWETVSTYGGKLTENVDQAYSRDALAEALLRLDRAGFPIVGQVHDEAIVEAPADALPEFEELMKQRPEWASTLPLVVEAFASRRYRK